MVSGFSAVDRAGHPERFEAYLDLTARGLAAMKHYIVAAHDVAGSELVLDIGCGTGHDLDLLADAHIPALGIDPSTQLLEAAQRRLQVSRPGAPLLRATGEAIPLRDASVGGCRIERVLQHVADPALVLSEAVRCLRPGGLLTVFEPDWSSLRITSDAFDSDASWLVRVKQPEIGRALWELVERAGCDVVDRVEELSVWSSLDLAERLISVTAGLKRQVDRGLMSAEEAAAAAGRAGGPGSGRPVPRHHGQGADLRTQGLMRRHFPPFGAFSAFVGRSTHCAPDVHRPVFAVENRGGHRWAGSGWRGRGGRAAFVGVGRVGAVGIGAVLLAVPIAPATAFPLTARLTAAVTPAATAPFSDGAPYPGPLPVSIAATGGAIQAENFNRGPAQQAYHACTPGDQGNGATYRSDPHDIDIFTAGGGNFYIRSSSPRVSKDPLHNCANSATLFSDYVKYSFTVATTGWYKITTAARNGQFETRVDDVNKGLSPGVGRTWTDALLVPAVHLTAGPTHVLTIEMLGFDADLDVVYFTPTTVDIPAPRVVAAPLTKNEVVVADAVATDPRFGAVPNNPKVDNRAAIQSAINEVRFEGGGTVFLPGGVYTVKGPLTVPANVTLRGDWSATPSASRPDDPRRRACTPVRSASPSSRLLGANAGISSPERVVPEPELRAPVAVSPHRPIICARR